MSRQKRVRSTLTPSPTLDRTPAAASPADDTDTHPKRQTLISLFTQPTTQQAAVSSIDPNPQPTTTRLCAAFSASPNPPVTSVVRLRRKNGVLVQGCDVYIGRACSRGGWQLPQSKWHNPFTMRACGSVEVAVARFEQYVVSKPELMAALPELKGKVLGCWCKEVGHEPCHGDVLARLADHT